MNCKTPLFLLGALLLPLAAQAQLKLDFDLSTLTITPGQTITFSGTVTNTSKTTGVNLVSDSYNLYSGFLALDDTKYTLLAPSALGPGESFSGGLFDVSIISTPTDGLYDGNFTILTDNGVNDVTQSFHVNVSTGSTVPAPGALTTPLLAGLIALASGFAKSRKKQGNDATAAKLS